MTNEFFNKGVDIPCDIAGMLLGAIICDMIILRSVTTKDADRETVKKLSKIAEVDDINEFAAKILQAREKHL